jgi:hypothetical protein
VSASFGTDRSGRYDPVDRMLVGNVQFRIVASHYTI